MLTKENIISTINHLEDPITIDDVLEKILLLDKIDNGIEESDRNQIISDEEFDQRSQSWFV